METETVEETERWLQEIISRGTLRGPSVEKPTVLELQLAHKFLNYLKAFQYTDKFIAQGFYPDYKKGLQNFGIK